MGPSQGERACIRGSEYILLEILDIWSENPPPQPNWPDPDQLG